MSKEDNRMFTVFFPSSHFFLLLANSKSDLCSTLFRVFRADSAMVGHVVNSPKKQYIVLKFLIAQIWDLERIGTSDGKHT